MRLGHPIITMQQSEDNGPERAVLMENSFKDGFDEKSGKDRGDRLPAHVDQPQLVDAASPCISYCACDCFNIIWRQ